MRLFPTRSTVLVATLLAGLVVASCDGTATTPVDPPGGGLPLPEGYWYLNFANDSALPATVATRIVGVAQEESVLDSAVLFIGEDGKWTQRYWYRVFVTGVLDRTEVVLDEGTWTEFNAALNQYHLVSSVRSRTILVSFAPPATALLTQDPMLTFKDAPPVEGDYRRTRP